MLNFLKELCQINGTSGREEKVREYILTHLPENAKATVDPLGNVIVEKKGAKTPKNKIMLSAHMDEVGMIVRHITADGFLKFINVGGISTAVLPGKAVTVGEQEIPGVIGVTPIHLRKGDSADALPKMESLYIDIGAKNREEAMQWVMPGDSVYFQSEYVEFGNGKIKAKAIDDRAGCAAMLSLLQQELPYDYTFCFLVQEEVGLRGAKAAAFTVNPDYAIVLESTTAADISGVSDEKQVCIVGKGTAVSFMDNATVYNKELFDLALQLAEKNKIPAQVKTWVSGGNDAGSIHVAHGGVKVLTLSVPCRYLHSPACVIAANDAISTMNLAACLAAELAEK